MITPVFHGSIEKGELKLISPQRFKNYLYTLNGKEIELVVSKKNRRRTNQQNKYYWGVIVKLISDHTGYNDEEIHEFLKVHFAPKKEIKIGKKVSLVPCSTTELFTTQFNEYVEAIRIWASTELSLIIPDPEEIKL